MQTTKLVIRVLDAEGDLLGWESVMAEPRGDGCLWATHAVALVIDRSGVPAAISVHWADVNVETRIQLAVERQTYLHTGQPLVVFPAGPVLTVGPPAGHLPTVTERRPVQIGIPSAQMGMRDPRVN